MKKKKKKKKKSCLVSVYQSIVMDLNNKKKKTLPFLNNKRAKFLCNQIINQNYVDEIM